MTMEICARCAETTDTDADHKCPHGIDCGMLDGNSGDCRSECWQCDDSEAIRMRARVAEYAHMAETWMRDRETWAQEKRDLGMRMAELEAQKNGAYSERNKLAAAFAVLSDALGWQVVRAQHKDKPGETWEADWRNMLIVETPMGQVSWHFHDSEAHLLDGFQDYDHEWDGHTTEQKYHRLYCLASITQEELSKRSAAAFALGERVKELEAPRSPNALELAERLSGLESVYEDYCERNDVRGECSHEREETRIEIENVRAALVAYDKRGK